METEKRLIDANAMRQDWLENGENEFVYDTNAVLDSIDAQPTVDAAEVVRCKDCNHSITDEENPGMCKCVESAEYDSESGIWLGFVEYHTPDFFCAYGERRTDHESESHQVD